MRYKRHSKEGNLIAKWRESMVRTKDKVIFRGKSSKTSLNPYLSHNKNSVNNKKTSNHSCHHKWADKFITALPTLNKDKNLTNSKSMKYKSGVAYLIISSPTSTVKQARKRCCNKFMITYRRRKLI